MMQRSVAWQDGIVGHCCAYAMKLEFSTVSEFCFGWTTLVSLQEQREEGLQGSCKVDDGGQNHHHGRMGPSRYTYVDYVKRFRYNV